MSSADTSRLRILRLAGVHAAACAVLVGRLFQLQVVEGDRWRAESERVRVRTGSIPFRRGAIVDRHGVTLARDRGAHDLRFQYRAFRRNHPVGRTAHLLSILSERPVPLTEVAADPGRCARAVARVGARHLAPRPREEREDAVFYLARLLGEAGADERVLRDALDAGERAPSPGSVEWRLRRRIDAEVARGEETPIAERLGVTEAALEAALRRSLADLAELERAGGIAAGVLLAEAEARRVAIDEEIAARRDSLESKRLEDRRRDLEIRAVRIEADLPFEGVVPAALEPARFAGLSVESTTRRFVAPESPVAIVGLVGRPSREDLEREARLAEEFRDLVRKFERTEAEERRLRELEGRVGEFEGGAEDARGRFGIEERFDAPLRGRRGFRVVSVDADGDGTVVEDEPAVDGKAIALTLDLDLQRAAERALVEGYGGLADVKGAVVLLDPRNGDVLALASNPSANEDDYRRRYLELAGPPENPNPDTPFKHRACDPFFPPAPGSVFKIVSTIAALEEGVVGAGVRFPCSGTYGRLRCNSSAGHGEVDLAQAIEHSCNVYFYRIGEMLGAERLAAWARRFGFGERTGIEMREIPGAVRTDLPDLDSARRFAMGQTLIESSPIQVARMVAAVANGGRLVRPRLVLRVGEEPRPLAPAPEVAFARAHLAFLQEAMRRVVRTGTARADGGFDLASLDAVGKTGTAEVGKDVPDHSWFGGYAPERDPRFVVVVYCERSGRHGGDLAAPIAERVLRRALHGAAPTPEEPR